MTSGSSVISDLEIWLCEDAPIEAAMRADPMLERGDLDG